MVLVLAGVTPTLAAEGKRNREITWAYPQPKPAVERVNPCAAHGPGFQALAGTSSCVKLIGGVRTDVTTSRRLR
jgi:hypothetical protein